jgi:hypothetical protein
LSRVLVVEHLISLQHAKRILMLFKKKQNRDLGYHFVLTDLGVSIHHPSLAKLFKHLADPALGGLPRHYAEYSDAIIGYHLKVYRTLP